MCVIWPPLTMIFLHFSISLLAYGAFRHPVAVLSVVAEPVAAFPRLRDKLQFMQIVANTD